MKKATKKKKMKLKSEGFLFIVLGLILLAIPIVNVYTKAILSESNIDLERVRSDIENQENLNSSLKMEISDFEATSISFQYPSFSSHLINSLYFFPFL